MALMQPPRLSIIVVFHDMAREAPRTLHTFSTAYQRGVTAADYEVIAVDHGSRMPLDERLVRGHGPQFRLVSHPVGTVPPSPAAAINAAVRGSSGSAVAVCIDGARMASPGIVRHMLAALDAWADPVVATLGWHLGPKLQNLSMLEGYDQAAEDRLLDTIDWRHEGYDLFTVSCLAGSCGGGWLLPITESNCLAMHRSSYERIGGFDERFLCPGGGLVGLDFFKRASESTSDLVLLLGEGTFHQFHGGVATNAPLEVHPYESFHTEYQRLRGEPFAPPNVKPSYLGGMPLQCLPFLRHSVEQAIAALPPAPGSCP